MKKLVRLRDCEKADAKHALCRLGEAVDDCHGPPLTKAVSRPEVAWKILTGMDTARDEHCVETHARRAQHISLQTVANREHLIRRRVPGKAKRVPLDRLVRLAVPDHLAADRFIGIAKQSGAWKPM